MRPKVTWDRRKKRSFGVTPICSGRLLSFKYPWLFEPPEATNGTTIPVAATAIFDKRTLSR